MSFAFAQTIRSDEAVHQTGCGTTAGQLYLYGNWSAYDELSDGVELTETLAMTQLEDLLRLRSFGVRFDGYLMDAFWFAPDGGYRAWRMPNWPEGPSNWLKACSENGLLPGLWFTANTLCHLDAARTWGDSVDEKGWGMCLFEGGFFPDFLALLGEWYDRGIRIFKFDFADFDATPAGRSTENPRRLNIAAFRLGMAQFRERHKDAVLLGFNGFETSECMDRTDRPFEPSIDPLWVQTFDSLYCGDPRPSDVPCANFWRSVDAYADHMVRFYLASGLPLEQIDNCGFMAGNTGTCYWRGNAGWKAMLLLSLARGGRIHVAYGDLSLFTDEDAKWWSRAQKLFKRAQVSGPTFAIGGVPGCGQTYGWRVGAGEASVAMVANPAIARATLRLPPDTEWKLAAVDDGAAPNLRRDSIELFGNQAALLVADSIGHELSMAGDLTEPAEAWANLWQISGRSPRVLVPLESVRPAGDLRVSVQQFSASCEVVRTNPADWAKPFLGVTARVAGKDVPLAPLARLGPIWSGVSWIVVDVPAEATLLTVDSHDPRAADIQVRAYTKHA